MPAAMSRWHARMMATALMAAACAGYGGLPADAHAQQVFRTPEQAMVAFGDAIASSDDAATERMLGRDARRVIPPLGADLRYRFLAAWSQHHAVQPQDDRTAHIVVGNEGWTLPIPLVRAQGGWRFDLAAGLTEMRLRRIGRNERATIETMLAVCDAQREYALQDHDGNGMLVYARKLISSPGKRDGLYWPTAEGDPPSPLGPAFLRAAGAGQRQTGYHGYRYRLLTSQGDAAPGGKYGYLVNGELFGGFAVLAWPVQYGETGIKSFMVNHQGQVYERDLGPQTATRAAAIQSFDPVPGWEPVSP